MHQAAPATAEAIAFMEPRTVTVPPDFAAAPVTDPGAKTDATRRRRIAKAVVALREERP